MVRQLSTAADGKRHLELPSGQYAVGVTDLIVKATNLLVRCYYPCSSEPGFATANCSRWSKWYPSREYAEGMARFKFGSGLVLPVIMGRLSMWATHDPYMPAVEGAPLIQSQNLKTSRGCHPLVVFSHGMGGNRTMYSTLLCQLASEGYFVAAVEHKDHSAVATFNVDADGNLEWFYNRTIGKDEEELPIRQKQVRTRVEECVQVLDLIEKLNRGEPEEFVHFVPGQDFLQSLESRIDVSRPAIAGHSFGGATVVKALFDQGSRFKVGLGLDTWMFPLRGEESDLLAANASSADVKPSLLFINCEKFQGENNLKTMAKFECPLDDVLDSNVLTLKKAIHYAPTDVPPVFLGSHARKPFEMVFGGKDQEGLSVEQQLEAFVDLTRAYLGGEGLSECVGRWDENLIRGTDYLKKKAEAGSSTETS